jgi:hypothetical protein
LEECSESAENTIDAMEVVLGAAAAPPVVAASARAAPLSSSSSSWSSFPSHDCPRPSAVDTASAAIAIPAVVDYHDEATDQEEPGDCHYEVHQEEPSHQKAPPQLEHQQQQLPQSQLQAQAQAARGPITPNNNRRNINSSNNKNNSSIHRNSNNNVYEDTRSSGDSAVSFSPSTTDNSGTSAAWRMEKMKSTLEDTLDENEDLLKDLEQMIAMCEMLESERSKDLDENAQLREHEQLLLTQIQDLQALLSESEVHHERVYAGTASQGMSPPPDDDNDMIDHNSTQRLNKLAKDNRQLLQERSKLRMELNEKLREDLAHKETFRKAQAAWQLEHLYIKDMMVQQQQEINSLKEQKMASQEETQKQTRKEEKAERLKEERSSHGTTKKRSSDSSQVDGGNIRASHRSSHRSSRSSKSSSKNNNSCSRDRSGRSSRGENNHQQKPLIEEGEEHENDEEEENQATGTSTESFEEPPQQQTQVVSPAPGPASSLPTSLSEAKAKSQEKESRISSSTSNSTSKRRSSDGPLSLLSVATSIRSSHRRSFSAGDTSSAIGNSSSANIGSGSGSVSSATDSSSTSNGNSHHKRRSKSRSDHTNSSNCTLDSNQEEEAKLEIEAFSNDHEQGQGGSGLMAPPARAEQAHKHNKREKGKGRQLRERERKKELNSEAALVEQMEALDAKQNQTKDRHRAEMKRAAQMIIHNSGGGSSEAWSGSNHIHTTTDTTQTSSMVIHLREGTNTHAHTNNRETSAPSSPSNHKTSRGLSSNQSVVNSGGRSKSGISTNNKRSNHSPGRRHGIGIGGKNNGTSGHCSGTLNLNHSRLSDMASNIHWIGSGLSAKLLHHKSSISSLKKQSSAFEVNIPHIKKMRQKRPDHTLNQSLNNTGSDSSMNINITGSRDGASNTDDGGGSINNHSKQAAASTLDTQIPARDALETTAHGGYAEMALRKHLQRLLSSSVLL